MDEKKKAFYDKAVEYLTEIWKYDITQEVFIIHSGDLGIIAKGEFGGYSLRSLIQFVAECQEKKIKYINDQYYNDEE